MILAHKIQFKKLTKDQEVFFEKSAGTARYTWNWALAKWQENYEKGIKTNSFDLKKEWNKIKPDWVYDSPKDCNQQPFTNLSTAFKRFFNKVSAYPNFKAKHDGKDSFYISCDRIQLDGKKVKLPLIGCLKLTEKLRFNGKIMSATISKKAGKWFISIQVDLGETCVLERKSHNQVGIDAGMTDAATFSNGEKFKAPKPFRKSKKKIAKLQRKLSRKPKQKEGKSNQWLKLQRKLQKAHLRLTNIRKDFWNKLSFKICSENQTVCVEDLNVQGMMKNHKLAFTLADIGLGEFFRQLNYKTKLFDSTLIQVDRWFPSSQLCSCCGHKQKMPLNIRVYQCTNCNSCIDRDVNAAVNILTEGLSGKWKQQSSVSKTSGDIEPLTQCELSSVIEPEIKMVNIF